MFQPWPLWRLLTPFRVRPPSSPSPDAPSGLTGTILRDANGAILRDSSGAILRSTEA
jgi:hypothetical protein